LVAVFLLALSLCPLPASAQLSLLSESRTLVEQDKLDAALERLDTLLKKIPDHVEARLLQSVIFTRQGRVDDAIAGFRRLADGNPGLPEPLNNLAVLYASLSRYDDARAALLKAIELQPGYDTAQENLGDLYAKLASLAYRRAHRLNRDNHDALSKAKLMEQAFHAAPQQHVQDAPGAASVSPAPAPAAGPDPSTASPATTAGKEPRQIAGPQASTGAAETTQRQCYTIGDFPASEPTKSILEWLDDRGATARVHQREEKTTANYLVFLPPFESRSAAEAQIDRLRRRGLRDMLTIARGDLENGVSLGVFSSLQGAERRVASLKTKGYAARHRPRFRTRTLYWIEASTMAANPLAPEAFEKRFPQYALSARTCP